MNQICKKQEKIPVVEHKSTYYDQKFEINGFIRIHTKKNYDQAFKRKK